ncbi:MAG: hypothetical protein H7A37_03925 [Chlamydiales bacterium]|nr:hypothetical protein [Chlamydiia bacterium]MCP5507435.1 hypothetical protein [Chlamydiales bacterium]
MLLDSEMEKLFRTLLTKDSAQIYFCGSNLLICIIDNASKLSVTTPVYFGNDYIPKSVRQCTENTPPFHSDSIKTFVTIDGDQVTLRYLGKIDPLNNYKFRELLTEFCYMAEKWRDYLDEHDKKDLLRVHVQ